MERLEQFGPEGATVNQRFEAVLEAAERTRDGQPGAPLPELGDRVIGPMGGTGSVMEIAQTPQSPKHIRVKWDANPTWPLWYTAGELKIVAPQMDEKKEGM